MTAKIIWLAIGAFVTLVGIFIQTILWSLTGDDSAPLAVQYVGNVLMGLGYLSLAVACFYRAAVE